jgi:hypothetical protein
MVIEAVKCCSVTAKANWMMQESKVADYEQYQFSKVTGWPPGYAALLCTWA